ncbi:MAG: ATP-binding protein, partial [Muribaculaceae bacterium]|nr:ATP-binding protein [Muribaculaceae bacterium]
MKDIHAVKGRFLIGRLVAEGEHECQDFKYKISDARKIARSLSAFANHKGGRLLIGVKDNGVIAGVRSEEDIFMIETAAGSFCRPEPAVSFKAYKATDDGAVVVIATVEPIWYKQLPAPPPGRQGRWGGG